MDTSKRQQTSRTFRIMALFGALLFIIGFVLRWMGQVNTPPFAMALAGIVFLFIGLVGLAVLRYNKPG